MKGWFTCSSMRRSRIIFRTLSDRTTIDSNLSIPIADHVVDRREGGLGRVGCSRSRVQPRDQCHLPSSFRIYLRANDRLVSFRSTIRTLPKAPRPTTRRRRKWLRFTASGTRKGVGVSQRSRIGMRPVGNGPLNGTSELGAGQAMEKGTLIS